MRRGCHGPTAGIGELARPDVIFHVAMAHVVGGAAGDVDAAPAEIRGVDRQRAIARHRRG